MKRVNPKRLLAAKKASLFAPQMKWMSFLKLWQHHFSMLGITHRAQTLLMASMSGGLRIKVDLLAANTAINGGRKMSEASGQDN